MYSMVNSASAASVLLLLLPLASCQWGPSAPHHQHYNPHTAAPAPALATSVPQDTPEVAAAKAAHFAAVAKAAAAASGQVTYAPASAYAPAAPAPVSEPAAPPPVNGVPQDTPEVAAAKAAHFAALAKVAKTSPAPTPAPWGPPTSYPQGPSHYSQGPAPYAPGKQYPAAPPPVNGVPQDTPEVAAAKAAHFAAVAKTGGPSPPSQPYYPAPPSPQPSYYSPTPAPYYNPPAPTPAPYYNPPAPTPAPYYNPPAHHYTPGPPAPPSGVPQDTPEVAAAKAAHFAALARVKAAPQPPSPNHWN